MKAEVKTDDFQVLEIELTAENLAELSKFKRTLLSKIDTRFVMDWTRRIPVMTIKFAVVENRGDVEDEEEIEIQRLIKEAEDDIKIL